MSRGLTFFFYSGIESHEDGEEEDEAEEGVLDGCRTFEYDPVKWTLTWKTHETNMQRESKKCSNLYQNLTTGRQDSIQIILIKF